MAVVAVVRVAVVRVVAAAAAAATVAVVVVGVHAYARRPSLYSLRESCPFDAVFHRPLVRAKGQR
jgi:hypothetical protein